jgi:putative two-component system response regulator
MAVVDVYDALTTARPYKEAMTMDQSLQIIEEGAGTHFDPQIVEIFCEAKNKLELAKVKLL